jgi:hypothetical protein
MYFLVQAYKNFYDAALFCLEHGGNLAEAVDDFRAASKFCSIIRGRATRG